MYAKTLTKAMMTEDPATAAISASMQPTSEKDGLTHVQLQLTDMHQIAKSLLIATAQYCKLEKELEKEWKLSVGWFKPSRLAGVTGEAIRDKHLGKLQKNQTAKGAGGPGAKDQSKKENSLATNNNNTGNNTTAKNALNG